LTLTHVGDYLGMTPMPMSIQGVTSQSALANNALYSAECNADGTVLHLYEIMLPDVPSKKVGDPSSVQVYLKALAAQGLVVSGLHTHWLGTRMGDATAVSAIHHQATGLTPIEFTGRTLVALGAYFNAAR
jgi:hypothetical protein